MQTEAQVVHTIVAIGETEIDVASAELHLSTNLMFTAVLLVMGIHNGRVVERLTVLSFEDTTLQPYLIGA